MEWFFYNLVILIKLYKIRYLNLDEVLLFPGNQAICLKNPTTTKFNIFCWNFAQVSYLKMSANSVRDFFVLFRSWVINKNVKNEGVENMSFLILANNSRSKESKKNPEHAFVDIGK